MTPPDFGIDTARNLAIKINRLRNFGFRQEIVPRDHQGVSASHWADVFCININHAMKTATYVEEFQQLHGPTIRQRTRN